MQIEKQKVNWSTAVKISTLAIGAIILIAEYALIQYFSQNLDSMYTFVILALFLIFLYFVLQSPRYIVLTEKENILQKLVGNLSIKRCDIERIDDYTPDNSDVRRIGSSGFCGYIGKFSNNKIGNYTSFVCNYEQAFLIQTYQGKNYVFSCENKELVINELKKRNK